MKFAYITFRYADHEYTATVRNAQQVISYVLRESRPFAISHIEAHGLTTSEELRIREACWNAEQAPSFDQSLLHRPVAVDLASDTVVGPEAQVKQTCCDIVNGCLKESDGWRHHPVEETVDDLYDGYDYTDGFGFHCVLESRSDGLWALHTIRKQTPAN